MFKFVNCTYLAIGLAVKKIKFHILWSSQMIYRTCCKKRFKTNLDIERFQLKMLTYDKLHAIHLEFEETF